MKQVIVFDLDDTLYNEKSFVISGFKAVAHFLREQYQLDEKKSFDFMETELENGRGIIFDKLLQKSNIFNKTLVKKCLLVYRTHQPDIKPDKDVTDCIKRLKDYPKYIVTDGNKIVQHNKLEALGLYQLIKKCYITHRYGVNKAKPSPHCMLDICKREHIEPNQAVYIGDNPRKDFIGLKPLGFKTVRILKGIYKNEAADHEHNADHCVYSLNEINEIFLDKIFSQQ